MSRRRRLAAIAAALAGTGALVAWLLLGPLSPSRRLAAAISRETGMPCRIGSVRPASGGIAISDLTLGAAPGPVLEFDRLVATGDLSERRLRTLTMNQGVVRLELPGTEPLRLTGVDVSAGNLGALTGETGSGPAKLAVSGHCFELNPALKEHGRVRFLRGRFTLSCVFEPGAGGKLDLPVRVMLSDFHVQSLDKRFQGEAGSAEAIVHLTGSLRDIQVDARELAPFLGGADISKRE